MYGTSAKAVEDVGRHGKRCVLDIESQVRACLIQRIVDCERSSYTDAQASSGVLFNACTADSAQGVKQVKARHSHLNAVFVFIAPPSLDALKSRLTGRGSETDDSLNARLATAKGECDYALQDGVYDVVIVNDDLDRAYERLEAVAVRDEIPPATERDVVPSMSE